MNVEIPFNLTIFSNRKKKDGQPDWIGYTKDNVLQIALWKRTDKNGKDYFSAKISENLRKQIQTPVTE